MMSVRNLDLQQAIGRLLSEFTRLIEVCRRSQQENPVVDEFATTFQAVKQLPAYDACINELQRDKTISNYFGKYFIVPPLGGYGPLDAENTLKLLLKSSSEGHCNSSRVLYRNFEETFGEEMFECEAIAPLQGLLLDAEVEHRSENFPIAQLPDDFKIRALTQREQRLVYLLELVRRFGPRWSGRTFAITKTYRLPKVVTDNYSTAGPEQQESWQQLLADVNDGIQDVLQALRTFKDGNIRQAGVLHIAKSFLFSAIVSSMPRLMADPINTMRLYTIDSIEEVSRLEDLSRSIWKAKSSGIRHLEAAVRWLSNADECNRIDDRIIALMISGEALSNSCKERRKGDAIAHEVASHFTRGEGSEVQRHMERAYQLRNSIMHEGDSSKWLAREGLKPGDLPPFVDKVECYLRLALQDRIQRSAEDGRQGTSIPN